MKEVFIAEGVRTAIGSFGDAGRFQLGGAGKVVVKAALERAKVSRSI